MMICVHEEEAREQMQKYNQTVAQINIKLCYLNNGMFFLFPIEQLVASA